MISKHLNDADIQQYVLLKADCDAEIKEHIQHCTNCKMKVEQYGLLFDEIKEQEKPIFDFNLVGLVMGQLPTCQQKVSNENLFFYFIFFIAMFFACIIFFLFGNNLVSLFRGITPILIGLIITTVTSLLVFLGIDIYINYQTQIQSLNF